MSEMEITRSQKILQQEDWVHLLEIISWLRSHIMESLQVPSMYILKIMTVLSFCSWLSPMGQRRWEGACNSPSACWFVACGAEKSREGGRKSSNWNINWFHRRSTKQQQRWILTSDFSLAIQNRQGIVSILVEPVCSFMVFCSLDQNIGRSVSEAVIITHCAFGHEGPKKLQYWRLWVQNSQDTGFSFWVFRSNQRLIYSFQNYRN